MLNIISKIKNFCTAKETINKMKKQLMEQEKIFSNHVSDKGIILKIYKEHIQHIPLNNLKKIFLNWYENKIEHFFPRSNPNANEYMQRYSTLLSIRGK